MVERDGNLMTHVVPDAKGKTLLPRVGSHVVPGSQISSDDNRVYRNLRSLGYQHDYVKHSYEQWAKGDTHTQSIEGVWSRLKNSIRGTHVHVSRKHLPKYLGEFEYRYNMGGNPEAMFSRLLLSF